MYQVHLYRTARGDSPIEEFLNELHEKDRTKIAAAVDYLGQQGPALRRPHAAHVRGRLWELRVSRARNEYRLVYFFMENRVVVVAHAFAKKTQAVPARELETAEKRMADFQARVKKGEVTL